MDINNLTFEEKVGQKLLVGINSYNMEIIVDLIKNCYIGGVLLYKKNYKNYEEMIKVIRILKEANSNNKIPLFIAIDQEGGVVNRFTNEITPLKNIYDISKTSKELISKSALITADILENSGINMNLAPVLDIYNNSNSRVLYKRCFYGDENNIYEDASKYIVEFNNKNIITVCKHFPGHGITKFDSHFFIPYVFNYKEILSKHVLPFRKAIKDNVGAIMVGHLVIRKLSPFVPATISSKFINGYLRKECKYNGIIMSDEVNMLSRNILYKWCYLNKVFRTDTDIILVKINDRNDALKVLNKAYKVINNNVLDDSVKRILDLKKRYNLNDKNEFSGIDVDKINKQIDKINAIID